MQAAEFTGRARSAISSTAPTPTARVAEGSFGDEIYRSGRPAPVRASHDAAATAAQFDGAGRVGALPRSTLSVAAGCRRFPRPQADLDKHSAEG